MCSNCKFLFESRRNRETIELQYFEFRKSFPRLLFIPLSRLFKDFLICVSVVMGFPSIFLLPVVRVRRV